MPSSHTYTWTPWTVDGDRLVMADENEWTAPLAWDIFTGGGKPLVFVDVGPFDDPLNSADLCLRMFDVIDSCPNLTFVLRTSHPENVQKMWPMTPGIPEHLVDVDPATRRPTEYMIRPHIWLLLSAHDQPSLDAGIEHLLECRDLVKLIGLDLTALTGPIDLGRALTPCDGCGNQGSLAWEGAEAGSSLCLDACTQHGEDGPLIDWVRVGGSTGSNATPCDLALIADIVKQCAAAGVPCEVTQLGSKPILSISKTLQWEWPPRAAFMSINCGMIAFNPEHPSISDPTEWPKEFQVQQTPEVSDGD